MSRIRLYLALTVLAGVAAGVWFAVTQEVDPAAPEPGAYDLFMALTVGIAMAAVGVACVLFEAARWVWMRLRR